MQAAVQPLESPSAMGESAHVLQLVGLARELLVRLEQECAAFLAENKAFELDVSAEKIRELKARPDRIQFDVISLLPPDKRPALRKMQSLPDELRKILETIFERMTDDEKERTQAPAVGIESAGTLSSLVSLGLVRFEGTEAYRAQVHEMVRSERQKAFDREVAAVREALDAVQVAVESRVAVPEPPRPAEELREAPPVPEPGPDGAWGEATDTQARPVQELEGRVELLETRVEDIELRDYARHDLDACGTITLREAAVVAGWDLKKRRRKLARMLRGCLAPDPDGVVRTRRGRESRYGPWCVAEVFRKKGFAARWVRLAIQRSSARIDEQRKEPLTEDERVSLGRFLERQCEAYVIEGGRFADVRNEDHRDAVMSIIVNLLTDRLVLAGMKAEYSQLELERQWELAEVDAVETWKRQLAREALMQRAKVEEHS